MRGSRFTSPRRFQPPWDAFALLLAQIGTGESLVYLGDSVRGEASADCPWEAFLLHIFAIHAKCKARRLLSHPLHRLPGRGFYFRHRGRPRACSESVGRHSSRSWATASTRDGRWWDSPGFCYLCDNRKSNAERQPATRWKGPPVRSETGKDRLALHVAGIV